MQLNDNLVVVNLATGKCCRVGRKDHRIVFDTSNDFDCEVVGIKKAFELKKGAKFTFTKVADGQAAATAPAQALGGFHTSGFGPPPDFDGFSQFSDGNWNRSKAPSGFDFGPHPTGSLPTGPFPNGFGSTPDFGSQNNSGFGGFTSQGFTTPQGISTPQSGFTSRGFTPQGFNFGSTTQVTGWTQTSFGFGSQNAPRCEPLNPIFSPRLKCRGKRDIVPRSKWSVPSTGFVTPSGLGSEVGFNLTPRVDTPPPEGLVSDVVFAIAETPKGLTDDGYVRDGFVVDDEEVDDKVVDVVEEIDFTNFSRDPSIRRISRHVTVSSTPMYVEDAYLEIFTDPKDDEWRFTLVKVDGIKYHHVYTNGFFYHWVDRSGNKRSSYRRDPSMDGYAYGRQKVKAVGHE
jgi:hypothetical protein